MYELVQPPDYLEMDRVTREARLEYVAGHVFALAGATRRHVAITRNLTTLLDAALRGRGCHAYATDLRLRVSDDLYFYPDVIVACEGGDPEDVDETAPILLAEVLSERTEPRDVGVKLAAYRSIPSLLAYLIVAQDARRVEVHWREEHGGSWRRDVISGSGAVELPGLGMRLPLERVYERTGVQDSVRGPPPSS